MALEFKLQVPCQAHPFKKRNKKCNELLCDCGGPGRVACGVVGRGGDLFYLL